MIFQLWQRYYMGDLRTVSKQIAEKDGFDGFKRVFYISALQDVGIDDLKVNTSIFSIF